MNAPNSCGSLDCTKPMEAKAATKYPLMPPRIPQANKIIALFILEPLGISGLLLLLQYGGRRCCYTTSVPRTLVFRLVFGERQLKPHRSSIPLPTMHPARIA